MHWKDRGAPGRGFMEYGTGSISWNDFCVLARPESRKKCRKSCCWPSKELPTHKSGNISASHPGGQEERSGGSSFMCSLWEVGQILLRGHQLLPAIPEPWGQEFHPRNVLHAPVHTLHPIVKEEG